MQGKATFRGHPLHVMLISFPVAFWSGSVAGDIAGASSHDPFWFRMSVTLIAAGLATGTAAAIFGYVDYLTIPMTRRAKGIAKAHLVTSLVTLALYAVAALLRSGDDGSPAGIAVSCAGALALLAGGYYGSELAHRYRVGISDAPTSQSASDAGR